mgnify:CR=1 FL=1
MLWLWLDYSLYFSLGLWTLYIFFKDYCICSVESKIWGETSFADPVIHKSFPKFLPSIFVLFCLDKPILCIRISIPSQKISAFAVPSLVLLSQAISLCENRSLTLIIHNSSWPYCHKFICLSAGELKQYFVLNAF